MGFSPHITVNVYKWLSLARFPVIKNLFLVFTLSFLGFALKKGPALAPFSRNKAR